MAGGVALAPLFGAILGSFLNVVAYRLPRHESLSHPGSRCPGCQTPVKPYDNIPVLSWLLLRGRCRSCRVPISARYPVVEAVTALLYIACVLRFGADSDVVLPLIFVTLLVPVALIDIDHRIIPNVLLGPAAIVAVGVAVVLDSSSIVERLAAGGAAGMFLLLAALAYPGGMGMGDVKLVAVMGLFLGRDVGPALLAGMVAATVIGIAVIARKGVRDGRKTAIPFGPFLALGGLVGLFAGAPIVDWYLSTMGR